MERRARGPGVHHEARRTEIADAVLAIVAERGLPAVSLTEVAAQAGVSAGRVQHYFPTKQKLIEAAFDRGNELSSARVRARVGDDLDRAEPRAVLTVVLTELIGYDSETRTHMRVRQSFTALALADEGIAERMRAEYTRFHRQVAGLVREDQDAGAIRVAAASEHVAVDLVALAEGLAYYVLIGLTSAETARDRVLAAVAELYS
ncbi:TetR family transcriptional regulator [Actinomadura sp. KC216]|uniref:TetR/AcrR family transcriptional regulator n=1 Tax=Actinomadura sp. KC216 TaxID=2530370 RepID=UPI0010472254|nr:TetR/AcrR family transcriptional regulator [Actinomadura sp. KC216]TDB84804.1 TetR family transcriptional regulator [Actinomadura sp. KC216]